MKVIRFPFLPVLIALAFFGAMFWAKGRDPFQRIWFSVRGKEIGAGSLRRVWSKVAGSGLSKAECVAVLPKMRKEAGARRPKSKVQGPKSGERERLPVVVYLCGSGGSLLDSGNELRQLAEMGLAAVGIEYSQTNEAAFDAQFKALLDHVLRQQWADTNRMAWVGFSLGAQRTLAFALEHPDLQPQLLVRVSGGWINELDELNSDKPRARVQSSTFNVQGSNTTTRSAQPLHSTFNSQLSTILLIHGERDEVFPLSDTRRVAECLRSNGMPVELKVFGGEGHGFGANRLQVFRAVGEYCLTYFNGPGALDQYRSILSWQEHAGPLWLFWLPAFLWICFYFYRRSRRNEVPTKLTKWEIGLRWVAAILATAAIAQTALHLIPPRLQVSERTLSIARKHLVQPKELRDFDFLSPNPVWHGKRLGTLLTHVELANYNRELINWKLDDQIYRDFVLNPQIDPESDGDLNWRRELWETLYPRIRKEDSTEAAAEIVVRFLRERVTITERRSPSQRQSAVPPGAGLADPEFRALVSIADIWLRQVTDERGFETVYVAALRSAGIPARLDPTHRAEFWAGSAWQPAPRPLIERVGWEQILNKGGLAKRLPRLDTVG